MNKKDYYLGLDIGTGSVGYAVTDEQYQLMKCNHKYAWGSVLFDSSEGAEERRMHHTARRNRNREVERLNLLRDLFDEEISKIDPGFFHRLKESRYVPEDKRDQNGQKPDLPYALFVDEGYTDVDYHKEFPTIYHLRKALIEGKKEYDVRLVYLAIAHILKNRGHFLSDIDSDNGENNLNAALNELFEVWNRVVLGREEQFCAAIQITEIAEILKEKISKSRKKEKIAAVISDGDKRTKELAALITGNTVKFEKLFQVEQFKKLEEDKISFAQGNYEEKEKSYEENLGEYFEIISMAKTVYDQVILSKILDENSKGYISYAKVAEYEKHKQDLKELKQLIINHGGGKATELYHRVFRTPKGKENNYSVYIGNTSLNGKKQVLSEKKCSQKDFYDFLTKKIFPEIEDCKEKIEIMEKIELDNFMPKLRDKDNSVIPYQLQEKELKIILSNAKKYLTFLKRKDESGKSTEEKILLLLNFRIPYYVGPLNTNSENAWIVRKPGKITPWNFFKMVDVESSAENFIKKLTSKCSYLRNEDVLPKSSLLYEKYMVLNEINHLKIKSKPISVELKQEIYRELFEKKKKVTIKKLQDYLKREKGWILSREDITGIGEEFHTSLTSYHAFKANFTNTDITEREKEDIIKDITVFGAEPVMLKKRLYRKYPEYQSQIAGLMKMLKCKEWGRLSEKVLSGIAVDVPGLGKVGTVIYQMWATNKDFMQIVGALDSPYAKMIEEENGIQKKNKIEYSMVDELYVSPASKRAIWKSLQIIDEIIGIMGKPPKRIFVEMIRENQKTSRSVTRKDRLMELYKNIEEEAQLYDVLGKTENDKLRNDKLYLYYTQLGKCAYTGEEIELDKFENYDIDHIYPQSQTADDSLDNRVLVLRKKNEEKEDIYPIREEIRQKMKDVWKIWKDKGLISAEKYYRLTRESELTNEELTKFINRQLVETGQSTRALTTLLKEILPETTEIVYSKARNVNRFRQKYEILKLRELNDFHHAKDAYLNIVVGNVYHIRFTKDIRKYFLEKGTYRTYNIPKLFENRVCLGDEVAWDTDKSIAVVKKVMENNKVLVTKQLIERKGKLFDENPLKKGKGQIVLKSGDDRLRSIEKYGAYNSATITYFMLIEGEGKKGKTEKHFVPVPLYLKQKYEDEAFVYDILKNEVKLDNIRILKRKIPIYTLFVTSGFKMRLTGKMGDRLIFNNANQLAMSDTNQKYLKEIIKYNNDIMIKKDAKINTQSVLDKQKMQELYEEFQNKIKTTIYGKDSMFQNVFNVMENGKEKFCVLTIEEEAEVLFQILKLFQCTSEMPKLEKIGGKKSMGRINRGMNITNIDNLAIIHQSVTGLYEKVERII